MSDIEQLQTIISMFSDVGTWILFAWFYITEKRAHEDTRRDYRRDLRRIANLHDPTDPDE